MMTLGAGTIPLVITRMVVDEFRTLEGGEHVAFRELPGLGNDGFSVTVPLQAMKGIAKGSKIAVLCIPVTYHGTQHALAVAIDTGSGEYEVHWQEHSFWGEEFTRLTRR